MRCQELTPVNSDPRKSKFCAVWKLASESTGAASPVGPGAPENPASWRQAGFVNCGSSRLRCSFAHRDSAEKARIVSGKFGRKEVSWDPTMGIGFFQPDHGVEVTGLQQNPHCSVPLSAKEQSAMYPQYP